MREKSRVKGATRRENAPKRSQKRATKGATPATDFASKPRGKAEGFLVGAFQSEREEETRD
ncbi:MAG TPA: hypothetical protein VK542_03600 [Gemmatimonadaceae bacterium]|nr:hypothetical protein [Gemmatimonadaceae bacterium]